MSFDSIPPSDRRAFIGRLEALDPAAFGLPYAEELLANIISAARIAVTGMRISDRALTSTIAITDRTLWASSLPAKLAEALFGAPDRVFNVRSRLEGEPFVNAAITGPPPGFEPAKRETLAQFIQRNAGCVVVFDDVQAFDPSALEAVANLADSGSISPSGLPPVSARDVVVLATMRVEVPSAAKIGAEGRPPSSTPAPLDGKAFHAAVEVSLRSRFPRYFSTWVVSRFRGILMQHLWRDYERALREGRQKEPLLRITDPAATVWEGRKAHGPPPAARDLVNDVLGAIPASLPVKRCDVFLSYRQQRNAAQVQRLAQELRARGLTVWLDADSLGLGPDAPEQVKRNLIAALVTAVRESRCTIAFAAGLEPYLPVAGMSNEDAVRHGLAMSVSGTLVKWSWQTLELDYSQNAFIVDDTTRHAYDFRGSPAAPDLKAFDGDAELLELVVDYLHRLGILPTQ